MAPGSFDDGMGSCVVVAQLNVCRSEGRFDEDGCDASCPGFKEINECLVAGKVFEQSAGYGAIEYQRFGGRWVEYNCGPSVCHGG